jgi:hypothetical protein
MENTRVNYNGLTADIRPQDLKDALKLLSEMSPQEKNDLMVSVTLSLQEAVENMQSLTPEDMRDTTNDIGIWFANEVIEGRSEKYKVMVSNED